MIAVILAGGSGTRFWPVSRRQRPKQLVELYGGKTMLRHTLDRLDGLVPRERTLIVTSADLLEETRSALPDIAPNHVLAEPVARNTAPAIALATVVARREFGDDVIVVLPSDHYVRDEDAFRERLRLASQAATTGTIVTLGISPSSPETGYGYIHYDAGRSIGAGFRVREFVEKPSRSAAIEYLDAGDYLWNAGIFVFRAETMLHELELQRPAIADGIAPVALAWGTDEFDSTLAEHFPTLEKISIDYAVMEGAKDVVVVPADVGWSDVGHWNALDAVMEPDQNGNLKQGSVVAVDTRDCVLFDSTAGVTATIGISDLVVVHTEDGVLVVPRDRAQDVRDVVAALEERGLPFL